MTPPQDRARKDGTWHHSKEICSPHPGHVSGDDNHSLLWINSGFRFCHQADEVNFEKEAKKKTRLKHLHTADQFRTFYYNPLRITHAVVPPLDQDLQDRKMLWMNQLADGYGSRVIAKDICGVLTHVGGHKSVLMKRMTQ